MSKQIPNGFGDIKISFDGQNPIYLKIWENQNFREEIEVADTEIDINGNYDKEVLGYYLRFNLPMIDKDPSQQLNINKLLYFYRADDNSDKSFDIHPIWNTSLDSKSYGDLLKFRVICEEQPQEFSILQNKQRLTGVNMTVITKNRIPVSEYKELIYRLDNNGAWGIYGRTEDVIGSLTGIGGYAGFGL